MSRYLKLQVSRYHGGVKVPSATGNRIPLQVSQYHLLQVTRYRAGVKIPSAAGLCDTVQVKLYPPGTQELSKRRHTERPSRPPQHKSRSSSSPCSNDGKKTLLSHILSPLDKILQCNIRTRIYSLITLPLCFKLHIPGILRCRQLPLWWNPHLQQNLKCKVGMCLSLRASLTPDKE